MTRRKPSRAQVRADAKRSPRWKKAILALALLSLGVALPVFWKSHPEISASKSQLPPGPFTYSEHIAPLIERRCAPCHRPGQIGPFPLLTYTDVKKRSADIARVTADRLMPPWLPKPGVKFNGERRLTDEELGLLQQWIKEGAREGIPVATAASTVAASVTNAEPAWHLGTPDLVVALPEPYRLSAEGRDVYRNFVLRVPLSVSRYVKGVEFRPGHARVVHHAFLKIDPTDESRRIDARDPEPGFEGMNPTAITPGGHFLGWQPGRLPEFAPEGLAWRLNPGTDLVLEMHLNPSGKPEEVRPSVGLYFTERAPTNACFKIYLTSYVIEIPAGARDYVVEDSYTMPVDAQSLAVLPHAHYLAREMLGWAILPDGRRQELLDIPQWDFNWQGDYRYASPVDLPKGTRLHLRFTYDNSTNNIRNPHQPPQMVRYGSQSVDEMAELWLQILPRRPGELAVLRQDFEAHMDEVFEAHDRFDLTRNPNDPKLHVDLAMLLLAKNRLDESAQHFRAALQSRPDHEPAHYGLGLVLRRQNRMAEATLEFEASLRLDPRNFKSHGNLGFIRLEQGNPVAAKAHFESALAVNPEDALAREGLTEALKRVPE